MHLDQVIGVLRNDPIIAERISRVVEFPARASRYGVLDESLADPLPAVLQQRGLERLYVHQVDAISRLRRGQDIVVVTGTASGKTLCYNLPVLDTCLRDESAAAFYLFPTKALCQDQLRALQDLLGGESRLTSAVRPAIYDGDTSTSNRRRIKSEANVVLTNPDMLHVGILPYHAKWARLFADLRYVVIDELHMYRGIFGANVAGVVRRLMRVCEHYGSRPQFICASATIANPGELAERLTGRAVHVVDDDGSPRGRKVFWFWNPPYLDHDHVSRRSASDEAAMLMTRLVAAGAQTLAFTRTRLAAELVYRSVRERLARQHPGLDQRVRAYRGGYLPNERRAIEQQLFSGALRGAVSTNALELGIDVGSLDAALLIGYPGTIASTWQQAGRSGRRHESSLAVLIAQNDPIDQYLMHHPEYFLGQSPEDAVVDPENPYILANQVHCAAFELPIGTEDDERFGPLTRPVAEALRDDGQLNELAGRFYATSAQSPAIGFSLRHMSDNTFAIVEEVPGPQGTIEIDNGFRSPAVPPVEFAGQGTATLFDRASAGRLTPGPFPHPDVGRGQTVHTAVVPAGSAPAQSRRAHRVIANVDAISAPELVYPQAVYLHDAQTYLVRELDLKGKVAYVERRETDYYTHAILESSVKIREERCHKPVGAAETPTGDVDPAGAESAPSHTATAFFGELDVSWKTVAFKKIKFETRENLGLGPVDIPAQQLATCGLWLTVTSAVRKQAKQLGLRPYDGLVGIRNLFVQALPLLAMSDPHDTSGVVDASNLGEAAVYLYDRYPGGLGYAEKGYEHIERLLQIALDMVAGCGCRSGCPSCVGLPNLRPAIHSDPDLTRGYPIPDKRAARVMLEAILHVATAQTTRGAAVPSA
jgi:ATP-dependent helicase YprA (DUF1998 family)